MVVQDFNKTFLNKDSEEIVELLSIALEQGEFENQRIAQYTMALEEALLLWREKLPEDAKLCILRQRHGRWSELSAQIEGDKVDPLAVDENSDDFSQLRRRILAGCGVELRYFYKNGTNILRIRFPYKKTEERVFSWNLFTVGIPIVLQMVLMNAINATDGFMLGFLNQSSLSAVSLANNFANLFAIATASLVVGLSILVSQFWGETR